MYEGKRRFWRRGLLAGLICVCGVLGACAAAPERGAAVTADAHARLLAAVNGAHRSAANRARDPYRHPVETLEFFGIAPDMEVVELWPFGGWYTEILAPYLRDHGVYYAAAMDPDTATAEEQRYNDDLETLFSTRPDLYSKVRMSVLARGRMEIAPPGTADLVVSFRNIHNWVWADMEKDVFAAAFRALKPGGVLGIVEHRHPDPDFEPRLPGQGYVGEDYAVRLIEAAGFRLVGRSGINDNPRDTKDYPHGVWTLPPTFAEGARDRAKYAAIGESDRFTLKFVKPEQ
ncbi:MAG: methyltransferase [Steroidobacteraceae bacterium]